MSALRKILKDLIEGKGAPARRLPNGLAVRYTPPEDGDSQHQLSLSRVYVGERVVNPSPKEIEIVKRELLDVLNARGGVSGDTVTTSAPLPLADSYGHAHGVVRLRWVFQSRLIDSPATAQLDTTYRVRG